MTPRPRPLVLLAFVVLALAAGGWWLRSRARGEETGATVPARISRPASMPGQDGATAKPAPTPPPPASAAPPASPVGAARGADVLLVTIDTLRADALGFAGNRRASTPVLDRLAATGRVFTRAHAQNVVTLPSHTNILTGLYPFQHGVRDNSGFKLPASIPTLATLLHGAGYATAAVVGAFPLDSRFGLDRGFDLYDDHYPKGSHPSEFEFPERRGDEVVRRGLAWWRSHRGEKRFLWLHLFDPHAPYAPPEPFASRFAKDPYLGEVAAVDSYLSPLLTPLVEGGEPPALVVVTGDHGEALGQHGELTHGLFAYEPTLHIPLVLWGPGVPPGRDDRLARHVDILPTLLEDLGIAAPPGLPGRSLLEPVDGSAPTTSYFEALSTNLNRGWAPLRGVLRGSDKLIELPVPELYDLARDPGEEHNLFDSRRRLARELAKKLPAESAWPPPRGEVSHEEAAALRSLGYLSGSAPRQEHYGPEDDPKNLVALDRKIHQVIGLYSEGRLEEATSLAREVVAERPSMPVGYSHLAQVLLQRGKLGDAIQVMEQARTRGVASDALLRQLGLALAQVGRGKEAVEVLRPLAVAGDPDSLDALGLALSEAGDQAAAKTTLEKALAADPDNPSTYENLGLVGLRQQRWEEARKASRRAVDLNERLPNAWNNLGVALYYLGRKGEALEAWQRAVSLDPQRYDTLYNLGFKAAEMGKVDLARQALSRFVAEAPPERYGPDIREARALLGRLGGG